MRRFGAKLMVAKGNLKFDSLMPVIYSHLLIGVIILQYSRQ